MTNSRPHLDSDSADVPTVGRAESPLPLPIELIRKERRDRAFLAWVEADCYPILSHGYRSFLHPDERLFFESLKYKRRQSSYLMGRYAAKMALSCYLQERDMTAIAVVPGVFTQPVVRCGSFRRPAVTISHIKKVACAIVFPDECPLGMDVEAIKASNATVMQSQMTSKEIMDFAEKEEDEICSLTVLWTAKEALSKVLKCGLTCPFEVMAVDRLEKHGQLYEGGYSNFQQYGFQSWLTPKAVITIALPKETRMQVDMTAFLERLRQ